MSFNRTISRYTDGDGKSRITMLEADYKGLRNHLAVTLTKNAKYQARIEALEECISQKDNLWKRTMEHLAEKEDVGAQEG